ncbi:MAG: class I SAM-dependent DNA methyltransferase [Xanthobacteraceae bacterium]
MFTKSEPFYDAIYSWKDYAREAARLRELIAIHKRSAGHTLLDVACGTGGHIPYFRDAFAVEGLDLDPRMLEVARTRHAGIPFHQGDMVDFDLGRRFDVVVCLFSSIGYVKTEQRLRLAIANMARHVEPGGVLAIEPYFSPADWKTGRQAPGVNFVDRPELKIARMIVWNTEGTLVSSDFHYLVGTPDGIEHFTERHEMGLFTEEQCRAAFTAARMTVTLDVEGLMGRGLYLGTRSPS